MMRVMDPGLIILILKIAVAAVTVLWVASLVALARGQIRLHGRINYFFFGLTLAALVGLEVIARIIDPGLFDQFLDARDAKGMLRLHLSFSMPAAGLLFVMLFTGLKHFRLVHIALGILFGLLWTGTFVTGIFFLPHQ
jgi:FtsH-binding integral membrane protein